MPFNLLSFSPSTILSGLMPGFHEGLARARPLVTNSRGGTREGGRDTDFDCAKKDSGELRNTAVILPEGCVICLHPLRLELMANPRKSCKLSKQHPSNNNQWRGRRGGKKRLKAKKGCWSRQTGREGKVSLFGKFESVKLYQQNTA